MCMCMCVYACVFMYIYASVCRGASALAGTRACGHARALYLESFSAYLELFAEHHDAFIATSDKFLYINSLPALQHTAVVRRGAGASVSD